MHATETEALDWAKHIFTELPVAGLLSARPIRCDPQRGRMTVAFQARREFCNLIGSVQGGMLTAMLDLVMSFSVLCALDDGHVVPSLEVKTSFIAPARQGEIILKARWQRVLFIAALVGTLVLVLILSLPR